MILYRFCRALIRPAVQLFFRRIEFESRESVPSDGPVLFVANHPNALVDPLLLVIGLRRPVTLTAKSVLARIPLLGWLMAALGVIPFHRVQDTDKGADLRQNIRSLQRCREVMAHGGAICIFPEGTSHSDPKLKPFQPGAARMALDYLRKDGNAGRLRIVPVGILYTAKDRFRSECWVRFGTAIDVAEWQERHPGAGAAELTETLAQRVTELTLNFESRRESAVLSWAADIVMTGGRNPQPLGDTERSVGDWFRLLERLRQGHQTLQAREPELVDDLTTRVRKHRHDLRRWGVAAAEVHLPMHLGRAALFVIRELELVVIGAPLAAWGAINHLIPYAIVKAVARSMSSDKDHWATNVIYPSLIVFPLCYAVQLGLAWFLLPGMWAALYTILLPFTGYYALLYGDRIAQTWRRGATFVRFLFRQSDREALAAENRDIVARIRDLGAQLEMETSHRELES